MRVCAVHLSQAPCAACAARGIINDACPAHGIKNTHAPFLFLRAHADTEQREQEEGTHAAPILRKSLRRVFDPILFAPRFCASLDGVHHAAHRTHARAGTQADAHT